jgi:hypothetical protein
MVFLALGLSGCPAPEPATEFYDIDRMLDPETCKACHENHYNEWAGSMHAYASDDPVFLAMNARGQRETGGELGDFCVKCHAPTAVRLGLTTDGLNLDDVPRYAQGVGCYFCHTVSEVTGTHNAALNTADDRVMRGGIKDPVANEAHASAYSPLLDRKDIRSADLCGSCHDIVTPAGVHLERTYKEWRESLFANQVPGQQETCGECHMGGRRDVAADAEGVALRTVHNHMMVGVDQAMTDFPQRAEQATKIQRELNTAVRSTLCVRETEQGNSIEVGLENMGVGHSWPSGATQDRRAWVEVVAYDAEGAELYSSGVVADDAAVKDLDDPQLWLFGETMYDADGHEVHMFWEATRTEGQLLPAPASNDPNHADVHVRRAYAIGALSPAKVVSRVRIRAVGRDVLRSLVDSGDLDLSYMDAIPTFTLMASVQEWRAGVSPLCDGEAP